MTRDAWELVREARTRRHCGDAAGALALYRQSGDAFGDDLAGRAHSLRHVGELCRELGRREEALTALQEAERLYRMAGDDVLGLANTVRLLALVEGDRRRWRLARSLYEQAAADGHDLQAALDECDRRLAKG